MPTNTQFTPQEARLIKVTAAILTTVADTPEGAPSGVVYAALMNHVSLDEYQNILSRLTGNGLVNQSNYLIRATPAGVQIANKLKAVFA
jgi:hypothetical protein